MAAQCFRTELPFSCVFNEKISLLFFTAKIFHLLAIILGAVDLCS